MKTQKYKVMGMSLKAVSIAALITLALFIGSFLDVGTQPYSDESNSAIANINDREEKIAVVNLDDGVVDSAGNKISYAEEILPEASKLYSIMSYSDAQKSLNDGNVDAVITGAC